MLFLLIFGILMLILTGFYLANSWREYHEWLVPGLLVLASVVMTVWGGIGFANERQHGTTQAQQTQKVAKQNRRQTIQQQASQQSNLPKQNEFQASTPNKQQKAQQENFVLRQLQKGYGKFGTVDFDENSKTFTITPTDKQSKQAISTLAQYPAQAAKDDSFNKLCQSFQQTSKQISKSLGKGYHVRLVNPSNPQQVVYEAVDGNTVKQLGK